MGRRFDPRERRLEELEELFEPPARISPAEFRARLLVDEALSNEIYERFEQGRTSGRFPALSEYLSHLSVKERGRFFKTGGDQAMLSKEGPEDSRVRFRQLQQLLVREAEFITRYPEAHEILFPRMGGTGLPLPSFGIRVLRHDPGTVARIPKGSLEGDAYSVTHLHHEELGYPPVNQSFWPLEKSFLRGLLLAILSREEYSERIEPSYCDPNLFEGREVRGKSAVRITDLRLAIGLDPGDLDHILEPALHSLQRPVTAERVVEWKHQRIGNSLQDESDSFWEEFGDRINEAQRSLDQEAFNELLEEMYSKTPNSEPPVAELTEQQIEDRRTEIEVISFAAAALFLCLDLDMPGVSGESPFRLAEQVKKLAALIKRLAASLDGAADDLETLLANRPAGRQRRLKRDSYQALVNWRMGHGLEDVAEWLGITPYSSKTVKGTRNWKKKVLDIIAQGKEVENDRYPRAAAIFANYEDSPHIRRKAHRAYRTYLVETQRMPSYYPFGEVGRRIRVDSQNKRGQEIIQAYIQLGCCLVCGIPVSP